MATKTRYCLSSKDIATICDIYNDIRFDFDQNETLSILLSGMFGGSGKHLRSVIVNGKMKWGAIDKSELAKIVHSLMSNHDISSKWSASSLLNKIEDVLLENKARGIEDVKPEVNALVKDIYEESSVEYEICMPIFGVSIAKDSCIEVGKYSFMHIDYVTKKKFHRIVGTDSDSTKREFWNAECFVCISVSACDATKAEELALAQFKWIENAIRCFLYGKMYNAGITNCKAKWIERVIVAIKGSETAGLSSSLRGPLFPFKIEEIVHTKEFVRMISLLGDPNSQLTEVQKRIRHAIYLCGLSTQTVDLSVGYFLCVAALEALFCKPENSYVSPSISQQVIESFCFLIIDECKRRECFDSMRDLYRNRSAVAHGGEKEISEDDVMHARLSLLVAIRKFLTDKSLCAIATISDLQALVKDIKFGKKQQKVLAK